MQTISSAVTSERSSAPTPSADSSSLLASHALTPAASSHVRMRAKSAANDSAIERNMLAPAPSEIVMAPTVEARPADIPPDNSPAAGESTPLLPPQAMATPAKPVPIGRYLCADAATAERLQRRRQPGYVKEGGSLLNPLNWRRFLASLWHGTPQRTVGLATLAEGAEASAAGGFVIDGFDDLANAITGSGISRQLAVILQSTLLYPLLMPLVNLGASGSRAELREVRDELDETNQAIVTLDQQLRAEVRAQVQVFGEVPCQKLERTRSPAQLARALRRELKRHRLPAGSVLAQRLSALRRKLSEQRQQRLALVGAPASVLGTHGMLAGVFCYEASTLAEVFGGIGAPLVTGIATLVGNFLMGGAQGFMAIYGVLGAIGAALAHHQLRKIAAAYQASRQLPEALSEELQQQCRRRQRLNGIIGGAQAALAIGQVLMLLGGPLVGLFPPLLFIGMGLTLAAIATRIITQYIYDRETAFDPDDSAELVVRQSDQSDAAYTQALVQARQTAVEQLARTTLLRTINKLSTPGSTSEQRQAALQKALPGLAPADSALGRALAEQMTQPATLALLAAPALAGQHSYLALQDSAGDPLQQLRDYQQAEAPQRLQRLLTSVGQNDATAGWSQHLIQQLVLDEAARDNQHGSQFAAYITSTEIHQVRTLLPNKIKHAYQFDLEAFIAACDAAAPWGDDGWPTDPVLAHVVQAVYRAIDQTMAGSVVQHQQSALRGIDDVLTTMVLAEPLLDPTKAVATQTVATQTVVRQADEI